MTNVELFDEYTARIMGKLYQNFPIRVVIMTTELSGDTDTNENGMIIDANGNPSLNAKVAWATLEWLQDTGFINCRQVNAPYAMMHCTLTAKGLEILKSTPPSIANKESVGDKLARLAKDNTIALAADLIKSAIAGGLMTR